MATKQEVFAFFQKWWRRFEKFDELFLAGSIIALIREHARKTAGKMGKRALDALGLSFEEAKKSSIDDFLFLAAMEKLNTNEIERVNNFKHWLRHRDDQDGVCSPNCCDEECAFILYIAQMMKTFESETKKVSKDNKTEISEKSMAKGINIAANFFRQLLAKPGDEAKRQFLEDEHVFEIIPEKAKTHPKVEEVKTKVKQFAKDVFTEATKGEKKNRQDFSQTMKSWRERSKAWRDSR